MDTPTRTINGKELAELLGVSPDYYRKQLKDWEHPWLNVQKPSRLDSGFLNPKDFFNEEITYENFPVGVTRNDRKTIEWGLKSLDLWFETLICQYFLYVGRTPSGEDVSISFSGDGPIREIYLRDFAKEGYRGVRILYKAPPR